MGNRKKLWWILGSIFGSGFIVLCVFVGFENALTLSCAGAVVLGMILYPFLRLFGVVEGTDEIVLPRKTDSGMMSCRKCGYLGAGNGYCTRCGSTIVEKLTTDTKMISCRKCGYLGAGSGFCTRCGSTFVEKIN